MSSSGDPRPPGDIAHLERLLDRWSKQAAADEDGPGPPAATGRLRRLVGVTVVAATLDGLRDSDGVERIGFKGGAALELRFGFKARTSKDLDAAYRGELTEGLALIADALAAGWNNFTGVLGEPEDITRAGITPAPVRVKIKLRYKNRAFITIPFEMAAAEGQSMRSPEPLPPAVKLAPVQLPEPDTIPFLPIRYQIAQKLHACTEDCGDPANQRVRDLADLLLIKELAVADKDLPAVHAACTEIFHGRNKHPWPPAVTLWPDWEQLWARLVDNEGLDLTLEEAATAVGAFIDAIDAAGTARP